MKIGDRVRVLERKRLFQKEYGRWYWSDTVHTIVASKTASDLVDGLSRGFKIDELQKVGEAEL